jgi:hypothetical protein
MASAAPHTVRHESNVRTHPTYRDAAPSVVHPKNGNPNGNFSGYGSRDVWGHWGAYYGPMIPTGRPSVSREGAAEQVRLLLAVVVADEATEMFEAHAGWHHLASTQL